jgi:agmatine deiminase
MFIRPAEWHKNKTIWLAWPADQNLWRDHLVGAQKEFIALVKALSRELVMVVVPDKKTQEALVSQLGEAPHVSYAILAYGDIWLRDTMPIFVRDEGNNVVAVLPQFNGWGKKYTFADDLDLSERVARLLRVAMVRSAIVFEGGAIECDGAGTLLTTEHCLLNKNRNPSIGKTEIEEEFARLFSSRKVIWLKNGLKNDHTDGHIDTIARFIAPRTIAIMKPKTKADPNYHVLTAIKEQLAHETDANGDKFTLVEVPSCGEVVNSDGTLMPASYLNFIIGDETLVVPLYGSPYDDEALLTIKSHVDLFVTGRSAKAILSGGGAFHCISQEYFR